MPVSASILAVSASLRVASLNLCTDEYLLLLGRPEQLASVSRLSHDPADSPLWRTARTTHANRGTLESALAARPNLLLTMGGGGRATGLIARKMGMHTLDLPYPSTIEDVRRNMVLIGTALGAQERARAWSSRLARIRRDTAAPTDAIFLGGGGISVSSGSLGAEWMRAAGLEQRALAAGRATLELLATAPPGVIVRSDYRRQQRSLGQAWLDHPIVARARSQSLWTDGRRWTCAGPLMLTEVERLRARR